MANAQTAWRDNIKEAARPTDKPVGRCLVDFLTENTDSGLRESEKKLLDGCANGEDVYATADDKRHKKALDAKQVPPAARLDDAGLAGHIEKLEKAISGKSIRAGFLRFLILGGDVFAPVHEAGIQLWNVRIEGDLDLRSCKCVSRVALTNCVLERELWMQDARLDVLLMSGSSVLGFHANRAKLSGAMWLNENFYSEGKVELFGIEIGGRLDCSSGYFAKGIEAPGAKIGGDLNLSRITAKNAVSFITAKSTVSFINADIGGTMFVEDAKFSSPEPNSDPLDFSRAKIKGDAAFAGTEIAAFEWSATTDRRALNAQNVKVDGSVTFGGGFAASGEVCFNGAEVSKFLDFSGGSFHNEAGYAIRAERSKVTGAIKCNSVNEENITWLFQSFGCVSLTGAQCGDLNCEAAVLRNPGSGALDCSSINVSGSVHLRIADTERFQAFGSVSLNTAQIGQHLDCTGGRFQNPGGTALDCQGAKIGGAVFMSAGGAGDPEGQSIITDGCINFIGTSVELQFICQSGEFCNAVKSKTNDASADNALNLSSIRVADAIFLGVGKRKMQAQAPLKIKGSINLAGAAVRVLIDDGLVSAGEDVDRKYGLWQNVITPEGTSLKCNLTLDQFTYERLHGDAATNPELRALWLGRQPPEDLGKDFKPQPFEQLISVMRAMGYDDEADDIALHKRRSQRRSTPLIASPVVDWRFDGQAAGVIAAAWLATFGGEFTLAIILLFWLFRKLLGKIGEALLLDGFIGYGYHMARAVFFLLLLGFGFGAFYASAFQQGAIVPADRDVPSVAAAKCKVWSVAKCPEIADDAIPLFNPWLYSADVMVPVVTLGQKAAWAPNPGADFKLPVLRDWKLPPNFVYDVQLVETVLGWVEGFLLVSFVTGLIAKE